MARHSRFEYIGKQNNGWPFPLIETPMQAYITSRFNVYLGNEAYFQYTPTLIHADLSPDHFIIDERQTKLVGIIDFGDMHITDPDYEYVYLLQDGGKSFVQQVMYQRGLRDLEGYLDKISLLVTFDQLHYILDGLSAGEREWIAEGIDLIREEMECIREGME